MVGAEWVAGLVAVVAGASGAGAGALARWWVVRSTRGVRVHPPWCEVAVALLWATTALGWAAGVVPGPWVPALLAVGWLGAAVAAVDLRHRRIPDALTLPALPVALLCVLPLGPATLARAAAGAAVAAAAHAAVHLLGRRALGAGDVKLAAPLGALTAAASWAAVPLATALAGLLTATAGVIGMATGLLRRGAALPHGPSMVLAAGAVVAWVATGSAGAAPGPAPPG